MCIALVLACQGTRGLLAYIVLSACTYVHAWCVWKHMFLLHVRSMCGGPVI